MVPGVPLSAPEAVPEISQKRLYIKKKTGLPSQGKHQLGDRTHVQIQCYVRIDMCTDT